MEPSYLDSWVVELSPMEIKAANCRNTVFYLHTDSTDDTVDHEEYLLLSSILQLCAFEQTHLK